MKCNFKFVIFKIQIFLLFCYLADVSLTIRVPSKYRPIASRVYLNYLDTCKFWKQNANLKIWNLLRNLKDVKHKNSQGMLSFLFSSLYIFIYCRRITWILRFYIMKILFFYLSVVSSFLFVSEMSVNNSDIAWSDLIYVHIVQINK